MLVYIDVSLKTVWLYARALPAIGWKVLPLRCRGQSVASVVARVSAAQ